MERGSGSNWNTKRCAETGTGFRRASDGSDQKAGKDIAGFAREIVLASCHSRIVNLSATFGNSCEAKHVSWQRVKGFSVNKHPVSISNSTEWMCCVRMLRYIKQGDGTKQAEKGLCSL